MYAYRKYAMNSIYKNTNIKNLLAVILELEIMHMDWLFTWFSGP